MSGVEEDTNRPFVVVLTGGPSAGKSSAMALLRDRLSVRGFQVLTVPENATHMLTNSDGFQPEWAGTHAQVSMQRIFLDYQVAQEEAFCAFAKLHPSKRGVLLLDCCTVNSKVYLSDEQWVQVCNFPGKPVLTEKQLFSRYDLVIHMITCANFGNYEWGPGSNNPGRYHSPEQAKESDRRCMEIFSAHPQMRVVPHFQKFDDKINKVLDFVNDALHVEGLGGKRHRLPVKVIDNDQLMAQARVTSTHFFVVTSTFLDDQMQISVRRRAEVPLEFWLDRVERSKQEVAEHMPVLVADDHVARPAFLSQAKDIMFERRKHTHATVEGKLESFMIRKMITEEDYYVALQGKGSSASTSTKYVMTFMEGEKYYELFFFAGERRPGLKLDAGEGVDTPSWLETAQLELQLSDGGEVPAPRDASDSQPPAKKARGLKRHSTESAAQSYFAHLGGQ